jgi:hypothetical protein
VSRADAGEIENLGGWLTTVGARASPNIPRGSPPPDADALERLSELLDGVLLEHRAAAVDDQSRPLSVT